MHPRILRRRVEAAEPHIRSLDGKIMAALSSMREAARQLVAGGTAGFDRMILWLDAIEAEIGETDAMSPAGIAARQRALVELGEVQRALEAVLSAIDRD